MPSSLGMGLSVIWLAAADAGGAPSDNFEILLEDGVNFIELENGLGQIELETGP